MSTLRVPREYPESTLRVPREYRCVGTGGDSAGIKDRAAASPRRRWAVTYLYTYIPIYREREMYAWLDVYTLSYPDVGHVRTDGPAPIRRDMSLYIAQRHITTCRDTTPHPPSAAIDPGVGHICAGTAHPRDRCSQVLEEYTETSTLQDLVVTRSERRDLHRGARSRA